jgi:hypothetical protein
MLAQTAGWFAPCAGLARHAGSGCFCCYHRTNNIARRIHDYGPKIRDVLVRRAHEGKGGGAGPEEDELRFRDLAEFPWM